VASTFFFLASTPICVRSENPKATYWPIAKAVVELLTPQLRCWTETVSARSSAKPGRSLPTSKGTLHGGAQKRTVFVPKAAELR